MLSRSASATSHASVRHRAFTLSARSLQKELRWVRMAKRMRRGIYSTAVKRDHKRKRSTTKRATVSNKMFVLNHLLTVQSKTVIVTRWASGAFSGTAFKNKLSEVKFIYESLDPKFFKAHTCTCDTWSPKVFERHFPQIYERVTIATQPQNTLEMVWE